MFQTTHPGHVAAPRGQAGDWSADRQQHAAPALESLLLRWPPRVHRLEARQALFHAGQPRHSLFYVRSGCFRTSVLSEDGREKITGFHLRGDLLAIDSYDTPTHGCSAVALDTSEVWELPLDLLKSRLPEALPLVTSMLANELRRDWRWMLTVGTLNAEQRVVAFLLDLAMRLEALGFSARQLFLRMTRAELGNFLSLQLETVTRALSRLAAAGMIRVDGREIRIENAPALRAMLGTH